MLYETPRDASSSTFRAMSTLQQLQTTCLGLLFSTQAHKVGFARLSVQQDVEILSERELYLLGLYDRLGEVCLERRVLEVGLEGTWIDGLSPIFFFFSHDNYDALTQNGFDLDTITGDGDENLDQKIMVAESELLQSTANTQMKGKVLEATLITHPILKAVHSGAGSTARER